MKIPAKKRFGQHFLRDTGTLDRIARLVGPAPNDLIIEVGAGDGALSMCLAPLVSGLLAIEIDPDCQARLEPNLSRFPAAKIVPEDVLNINLEELVAGEIKPDQKLRVVGNLPYNIATSVIERFLHSKLAIAQMVFMVQLEVAERIIASPKSRQYGYLSVACQRLAEARIHFKVSPSCFVPRPGVTSAVISLRPYTTERDENFEYHFEELVKACFGHRRKTVANSLRRHPKLSLYADKILAECAINPSRRAEELPISEFEKLTFVWMRTCSTMPPEHGAARSHKR
jgi:16S rRNA (adenine1518-N6/adenine1519-N6)-dimethyltransferase